MRGRIRTSHPDFITPTCRKPPPMPHSSRKPPVLTAHHHYPPWLLQGSCLYVWESIYVSALHPCHAHLHACAYPVSVSQASQCQTLTVRHKQNLLFLTSSLTFLRTLPPVEPIPLEYVSALLLFFRPGLFSLPLPSKSPILNLVWSDYTTYYSFIVYHNLQSLLGSSPSFLKILWLNNWKNRDAINWNGENWE